MQAKCWSAWIWLAVCQQSRQVVAWVMGDRSRDTCRGLWNIVPEPWRKATCYSDFWEAYQRVIPATQHRAVGKETSETAHVERKNNIIRQRLGRFVRQTLSFSKSDLMHNDCLSLFLHEHNRTLQTP